MNPKCNGCGEGADVCACFPAYSGQGTAKRQVLDAYPTAFARRAALPFSAAWTIVVTLSSWAAERIGEGDDEEAAWEDAATKLPGEPEIEADSAGLPLSAH